MVILLLTNKIKKDYFIIGRYQTTKKYEEKVYTQKKIYADLVLLIKILLMLIINKYEDLFCLDLT